MHGRSTETANLHCLPADSADVRLYGIAVDVVGNKLYYCDAGDEPGIGEFSMDSVDASADSQGQHRVLFTNNTLKPRSLAFYDGQGSPDNRSACSFLSHYVSMYRIVRKPRGAIFLSCPDRIILSGQDKKKMCYHGPSGLP